MQSDRSAHCSIHNRSADVGDRHGRRPGHRGRADLRRAGPALRSRTEAVVQLARTIATISLIVGTGLGGLSLVMLTEGWLGLVPYPNDRWRHAADGWRHRRCCDPQALIISSPARRPRRPAAVVHLACSLAGCKCLAVMGVFCDIGIQKRRRLGGSGNRNAAQEGGKEGALVCRCISRRLANVALHRDRGMCSTR